MHNAADLPDARDRTQAETTFDRNVVVIAGAGTGKTTLLVNRLVNLLVRDPDPLAIEQIVALTFTNKAATEMKVRLRGRLTLLTREDAGGAPPADPGEVTAAELCARYHLSSEEVAGRARAALASLDKAQIGTLHSFAAHVLRLYPLESGVDPGFREDDGARLQELFSAHWDLWLDRELGEEGGDHARWRRVLAKSDLAELRALAHALCSEFVWLDGIENGCNENVLDPVIQAWLAETCRRGSGLLRVYEGAKRRKVETMLESAVAVLEKVTEQGLTGLQSVGQSDVAALARDLGSAPQGWVPADFQEAGRIIGIARRLFAVDREFFRDVLALLRPLVVRVRAAFVAEGWISFDGLLARARDLLRGHPRIRERLKRDYRAVLVDEFQDTDPAQYEILLYLAEEPGLAARDWQDVRLDAGKLFIVGDPKQSIYAFRRADIEAFDRVVEKIGGSGGLECQLTTNFRSHGSVLAVVNAVFERLFVEKAHLQPKHVPLQPRPGRPALTSQPGVWLRVITAKEEEEELDSVQAARAEAEALARWLKNEVIGRMHCQDALGRSLPMEPGHIALLFRKLTQAQEYLDALRRHDLLYVTDGEKHFYRRQEIVDLINVLRCLDNPHDRIALVGVLRSALGGLTDRALFELGRRGPFDYRDRRSLDGWEHPAGEAVRRLYGRLAELSEEIGRHPLPAVLDLLFARLPVLELAAASADGEQAVANLLKIRQIGADLSDRPHLTLSRFVDLMVERLNDPPDEAESALAEESLEAIRVLTIHKAKGLEFPLVVLPGLHQSTNADRGLPLLVHDWSTGVQGVSLGDRVTPGAILASEKQRAREVAERRRLLYVGMTRARDTLVLSGAKTRHPDRGSIFAMLQEAAGQELGIAEQAEVKFGGQAVSQCVVEASEGRRRRQQRGGTAESDGAREWTPILERWKVREQTCAAALSAAAFLTPSLLMKTDGPALDRPLLTGDRSFAGLAGVLTHRMLEAWKFSEDLQPLEAALRNIGAGLPEQVCQESRMILQGFFSSGVYARLCRARILGREVPFVMPWRSNAQANRDLSLVTRHSPLSVMEGVIDLIYELNGEYWIADYKTDQFSRDQARIEVEVKSKIEAYRPQLTVYRQAVQTALAVPQVRAQVIFLRLARAVEVS
jgi:ATP-dependent helicase/nuclease subunit A